MQRLFLSVLLIGFVGLPVAGHAKELPLWEAGFGVAGLSIPDYRGSDERRGYVLPLPYLIYRGDAIGIDREGIHGKIFKSDRVKLDVSLGIGPPAKSDENKARAGMPDIDPTVEAGPSLKIRLKRNESRDRIWSLRLPLRVVFATNLSHFRQIGWVFSPHLNFEALNIGPGRGWNLGFAMGPLYATEKYHDYFYEVAPEFATPTRPAFNARGGYSGSRITLSLSKRFPKFWVGAFARYDALSGAVFEDSPLVKRNESFMFGGGVAWIFAKSKTKVQRNLNPSR